MNQLKVFTVKEVNEMIPRLESMIRELQKKRDAILNLEVEIDSLELIAEKKDSAASPLVNQKVEEYTSLVNDFYKCVDTIHETGCVLKDIDAGLLDFYSLYKGKVVYLCWKMGEPEVGHWHEIGSGFGSRQVIEKQPSQH